MSDIEKWRMALLIGIYIFIIIPCFSETNYSVIRICVILIFSSCIVGISTWMLTLYVHRMLAAGASKYLFLLILMPAAIISFLTYISILPLYISANAVPLSLLIVILCATYPNQNILRFYSIRDAIRFSIVMLILIGISLAVYNQFWLDQP